MKSKTKKPKKTKKIGITVDQKIKSLNKKLKKIKNEVFIKKIICKKTKNFYENLFKISEKSLVLANEHFQKTKKLFKWTDKINWFYSIIFPTVIVLTIIGLTNLWSSAKSNLILSILWAILLSLNSFRFFDVINEKISKREAAIDNYLDLVKTNILFCETLSNKKIFIYYNWFVSEFNKINLTSPTISEFNFLKNFIKNKKTKSTKNSLNENKQKIFKQKEKHEKEIISLSKQHDFIFSFLETIKLIYKLLESIIAVGFIACIGFLFSSNNETPLLIFGIIGGLLFITILVSDIFKLDMKIRNNNKIIKDLNILFAIVVIFNDVYIDSEEESELFKKLTRINSRKNKLKKKSTRIIGYIEKQLLKRKNLN